MNLHCHIFNIHRNAPPAGEARRSAMKDKAMNKRKIQQNNLAVLNVKKGCTWI